MREFINKSNVSHVIQCGRKKKTAFSNFLEKHGEHNVLVYGTENARNASRSNSKTPIGFKKVKTKDPIGSATQGFYTIDKYNNYSWRDFQYYGKAYFSIFNPDYMKNVREDSEIKKDLVQWTSGLNYDNKEDKQKVLDYQAKLLEHSSYSPIVTYREGEEFISNRTGYSNQNIAKGKFELQTRRACKFGLEYMANKRNGMIAFLPSIDGQSMPGNDYDILNKTKSNGRAGGRQASSRVPITTSELLKAYRLGTKNISFFDNEGEIMFQPWETHGVKSRGVLNEIKSWEDYGEKRLTKYKKIAFELGLGRDIKGMNVDGIKKSVIQELYLRNNNEGSPSELLYLFNEGYL